MVLDGIDAAQQAGFPPPQINMVVLRGINEQEIADFAPEPLIVYMADLSIYSS